MPIANTRLAALELLAEGLEPHDVETVYLAAPDRATHWLALEQQDLDRKIAAMHMHVSQVGDWDAGAMLRQFAAAAAEEARRNGVACEFAEAYVQIALRQPPAAA